MNTPMSLCPFEFMYPADRSAENAGLHHKGDCLACGIDNGSCLCKVRPSA